MKIIKVNFVDFWKSFIKTDNYFYHTLSIKYQVEISNTPDYLFCGTMGNEHLKYQCIKLFFTGENIYPDFNLFDYAMGFHNIVFDDRYLRLPLYVLYPHAWRAALNKHTLDESVYNSKRKFCNYVISNSIADDARDRMISLLNAYKTVDSGGRYKNNIGAPVADKITFAKDYRFTMCFENSSAVGYTTEKIVEAFASCTIPIYWGNPEIAKEFNPKAFINCHDYDNFEAVAKRVKEIDANSQLWTAMLKEPACLDTSSFTDYLDENYALGFLSNIIEQDVSKAFRRNTVYIGKRYEQRMRTYRRLDLFLNCFRKPAYYIHNKLRQIFHTKL